VALKACAVSKKAQPEHTHLGAIATQKRPKEARMKKLLPVRNMIVRGLVAVVTSSALVGLASMPAWGDNPHYLKADPDFIDSTGCLSVAIKEAGLGNSGLSAIQYALTCTAQFESVCVTKQGNNFVQGQPKSGTGTATSLQTLTIRNGQTNGTIQLCPANFTLPDPGCTGSQRLFIIDAEYTQCSLNDGLGTPNPLDPTEVFGGEVFIQVP
jgi:hypothetical protein